jgi:hypothetical protein
MAHSTPTIPFNGVSDAAPRPDPIPRNVVLRSQAPGGASVVLSAYDSEGVVADMHVVDLTRPDPEGRIARAQRFLLSEVLSLPPAPVRRSLLGPRLLP